MLLPSPTDRLILRCWQDEDFPAFARMNADSQMMEYFPAPLSLPESAAFFDRIRREFETEGFGLYALERRTDGELLGYTRLHRVTFDGPLYGRVEIGWRNENSFGPLPWHTRCPTFRGAVASRFPPGRTTVRRT